MRRPSILTALILLSMASSPLSGGAQLPGPADPPTLWIGRSAGLMDEVFGRIVDVEVASDGSIFILDAYSLSVRWFGPDGKFRGSAGEGGLEPGQFTQPAALSVDSRNRLHVLDAGNRRISTFQIAPEGLTHTGDRAFRGGIDLCSLGERLFVLAGSDLSDEHLLHEIDDGGKIVKSFGSFEKVRKTLRDQLGALWHGVRGFYNRGKIACHSDPELIVLVHEPLPLVRAFSPGGERQWRTILLDYHRYQWMMGPSGGEPMIVPDMSTGTGHRATGVATTSDGKVIITLREGTVGGSAGTFQSRVLDLDDGIESLRAPARMTIVSVRGGKIYGFVLEPFPQVFVF